ncbi:MAG: type II toxin-antitoxin system RelE/ParE family toxin [Flavobacteriaceae bacterium]|nr:type II toxin-antitoxin system RelE/ParE family toxin [Flavobacteriaceae bacterium]
MEHNQSNQYSLKIISEVERFEALLKQNPYIGSIVENTNKQVRRVVILSNFSLFYRIVEDNIQILSFWRNKNNPEELTIK